MDTKTSTVLKTIIALIAVCLGVYIFIMWQLERKETLSNKNDYTAMYNHHKAFEDSVRNAKPDTIIKEKIVVKTVKVSGPFRVDSIYYNPEGDKLSVVADSLKSADIDGYFYITTTGSLVDFQYSIYCKTEQRDIIKTLVHDTVINREVLKSGVSLLGSLGTDKDVFQSIGLGVLYENKKGLGIGPSVDFVKNKQPIYKLNLKYNIK